MNPTLEKLVMQARAGNTAAYSDIVRATQGMAAAVAVRILRDASLAEDAVQQAYMRALRSLDELGEPAAFPGWLRRIVITVALNIRRARRTTFLRLDDMPEMPVLDEAETRWSERQREQLAAALLTLSVSDRQLCDRRYHGGRGARQRCARCNLRGRGGAASLGQRANPALRPYAAALARRPLRGPAAQAMGVRQGVSRLRAGFVASRGVPPGRGLLARPPPCPRSMVDVRARVARVA